MKKMISFRLDEKVLDLLKNLNNKYAKLNVTDLVDMAIKSFLLRAHNSDVEFSKMIGEYMKGDTDQLIEYLHKDNCKKKKS